MAKIQFGTMVSDARGAQGGVTYARNKGGAYARQTVSPVQPLTARQTAQRAIFAVVTKAWQTTTPAQQAGWNAWALINKVVDVFGNQLTLSGINAYLKINGTLMTFGLPTIQDAPAPPAAPGPLATTVTGVAATGILTITWASALAGGELYQIWSTQGVSAGAVPQKNLFRLAANLTGIAAAATTTVTPTVLNPKLVFTAGQKVSVLVVRLDAQGLIIDSTRYDFIGT